MSHESNPTLTSMYPFSDKQAAHAAKIMAAYDMRAISRSELIQLAHALFVAGVLTAEQRVDFTVPFLDAFSRVDLTFNDVDEERDRLKDLESALERARKAMPESHASVAYFEKVTRLARSLDALRAPGAPASASAATDAATAN